MYPAYPWNGRIVFRRKGNCLSRSDDQVVDRRSLAYQGTWYIRIYHESFSDIFPCEKILPPAIMSIFFVTGEMKLLLSMEDPVSFEELLSSSLFIIS